MGYRAKHMEVRDPRWHVFQVNENGKLRRPIDVRTWGGGLLFGAFDSEAEAWEAVTDKADELPNREILVLPVRYVGVRL